MVSNTNIIGEVLPNWWNYTHASSFVVFCRFMYQPIFSISLWASIHYEDTILVKGFPE